MKKKQKQEVVRWEFNIILWDETGNVKLERKTMNVHRTCQFTAQDYVRTKFPRPYETELNQMYFRNPITGKYTDLNRIIL